MPNAGLTESQPVLAPPNSNAGSEVQDAGAGVTYGHKRRLRVAERGVPEKLIGVVFTVKFGK